MQLDHEIKYLRKLLKELAKNPDLHTKEHLQIIDQIRKLTLAKAAIEKGQEAVSIEFSQGVQEIMSDETP